MNATSRFFMIAARLRQLSGRSLFFGLVCGIAISAGASALAGGADMAAWHHGAPITAQDLSNHVDHLATHLYTELGVTDSQKAQLDPIVEQIVADIVVMHEQVSNAHMQTLSLLAQDTVDRNAIEAARAAHVAGLDQSSKAIAQLIGDFAEVLTPAQRKALAAHIAQMHAQAAQG